MHIGHAVLQPSQLHAWWMVGGAWLWVTSTDHSLCGLAQVLHTTFFNVYVMQLVCTQMLSLLLHHKAC